MLDIELGYNKFPIRASGYGGDGKIYSGTWHVIGYDKDTDLYEVACSTDNDALFDIFNIVEEHWLTNLIKQDQEAWKALWLRENAPIVIPIPWRLQMVIIGAKVDRLTDRMEELCHARQSKTSLKTS